MIVFRVALAIFALILIFIGAVAMIAPTPFGFVFVGLGFLILASAAPSLVRWLRRRWRWLDRQLDRLQKHGPRWVFHHLRHSDPQKNEEGQEDVEKDDENTTRP